MQEIEISQCLFVFICKTGQPIKPIQQKSYLWNSIFFIFLKFPHQVDMKNIVKWTVVMGFQRLFCYIDFKLDSTDKIQQSSI